VPGRLDVDIQHNGRPLPGRPWSEAIATGVLTAIAYFLAARLSLVLLAELQGVAVFWPASGVAVGILLASGPRARAPVAIGVIVATVAANLLGDRNLWASLSSGFCNAGGASAACWAFCWPRP
jgi:integral membrane sensor domain MASE1